MRIFILQICRKTKYGGTERTFQIVVLAHVQIVLFQTFVFPKYTLAPITFF